MTSPSDEHDNTFAGSIEDLLRRLRRRSSTAIKRGAVYGTLSLAAMASAVDLAGSILAPSKALAAITDDEDWAQREGIRNEDRVHYYGELWSHVETEGETCGFRGCYGGITTTTIFVKVRVAPVAGADLDAKRVGVVFRQADGSRGTSMGHYFTTHDDGYEEWHVPIEVQGYQSFVAFNAWYQDGTGSPTWYDDNAGELHVAQSNEYYQMIGQIYYETDVSVEEDGIYGTITIDVQDIDYDKDIRLVYTTDNWETVREMSIGTREGELNRWLWHYNHPYGNRQRWALELELPGSYDHIEYAIVYRHGVRDGADVYEYWANNYGRNFRVVAPTPEG